jgi:hypothetical protein
VVPEKPPEDEAPEVVDKAPVSPTGTLSHAHPVTSAAVGQRRSFIVRVAGRAESVSLVLTHGGAPEQHRALSPFRDGFWGLVVPFFGEMEGEVTYRFESPGMEPTETYTMEVGSTSRE